MSPTRTQAFGEMSSSTSKYSSFGAASNSNNSKSSSSSKYHQDSSSKAALFGSTRKGSKCDNCNEDRSCTKTKQSCDKYDW